jgi:hypothetical protein
MSEHYRQRAEYCERMAKQSAAENLTLDWIALAKVWHLLAARASELDAVAPRPRIGRPDGAATPYGRRLGGG